MYRHLDEARRLTSDPAVRQRLDGLVLYTRYLELYYAYRAASGEARQQAYEQVMRHAYRIHDHMMVHTAAMGTFRDSAVTRPEEAAWRAPVAANPWRSAEAFAEREIAAILAAGIHANQPTVLDFEQVVYSEDLVPATRLNLPAVTPLSRLATYRGNQRYFTWMPEGRDSMALDITAGLVYRDRGHVNVVLQAEQEATLEPVAVDRSVVPNREAHGLVLRTPHAGLHVLEWSDGAGGTRVELPGDLPFTLRASIDDAMRIQGNWSLYFYVPRGTSTVGGYSSSTAGRVLDGAGNAVFSFRQLTAAGYFSIPVPQGQDGKLWKFENVSGARLLMTVPPYLAPSAQDLLLPREIVDADAQP
jgi:hypothetical protein